MFNSRGLFPAALSLSSLTTGGPCLISRTRCANFPDFTKYSICFLSWKQSLVSCPLPLWYSQYLLVSLFGLSFSGFGGLSLRFSEARISAGVLLKLGYSERGFDASFLE
ncbi:hypothetical protein Hanom_Chr14g01274661 [Helianthus anomalus]